MARARPGVCDQKLRPFSLKSDSWWVKLLLDTRNVSGSPRRSPKFPSAISLNPTSATTGFLTLKFTRLFAVTVSCHIRSYYDPGAKQRALLLGTGQVHPSTSSDQGLIRSGIRFPPSGERLSAVGGGEQGLDPSLIGLPTNWRSLIPRSSSPHPRFHRMQTIASRVAVNAGCLSETREKITTRTGNRKGFWIGIGTRVGKMSIRLFLPRFKRKVR